MAYFNFNPGQPYQYRHQVVSTIKITAWGVLAYMSRTVLTNQRSLNFEIVLIRHGTLEVENGLSKFGSNEIVVKSGLKLTEMVRQVEIPVAIFRRFILRNEQVTEIY